MNLALSTLALAGLLAFPSSAAAQEANQGLRLAGADGAALDTGTRIADIQQHRIRSLDYVRRFDDIVHFDASAVDTDADPVMWIDGDPVARSEFRRRATMYVGVTEVDKYILNYITLLERDRRIAKGEDPAKFAINDAVVSQKMADYIDLVRSQAEQQVEQTGTPDEKERIEELKEQAVNDFLASVENSPGGMDMYRDMLSAEANFERVFFPDATGFDIVSESVDIQKALAEEPPRPEWYPQGTWDALDVNDQTKNLRYFLMNSVIDGTGIPAFFKTNIVQQIKDGLITDVGLKFFFDDSTLPANALFRVGERVVMVDELWPVIAPILTSIDIELSLRELVKLRLMRAELEDAGFWVSDEEFEQIFADHRAEYDGTLFPLKNIIIFRGYSWLDRYREHYRHRRAYASMLHEDLSDEEVLAHYQTGGRLFFERGHIVLDVAFAPVQGGFNQQLFDDAQAKLEDTFADVGGDFAALVAEMPMWETRKKRGDDRTFQRAPARMRLAESELSIFLTGYSITDDAFYHGVPGEIFGPWPQRCRRHAWGGEANAGVWMLRVEDFTRRQVLPPFEDRNRTLAIEDYTDLTYQNWSEELLAGVLPTVKFAADG